MSKEAITELLGRWQDGDEGALAELLPYLHTELKRLAGRYMQDEAGSHTLQSTALVNEAYLRLVDQRDRNWESKNHFLAIASTAMRRVLLEHARARMAEKRGGGAERVTFFEVASAVEDRPENLVALDEALERFAEVDPANARIAELRWFGGLSVAETAAVLEVSTRTVERGWRAAAAWLRDRLEADGVA